MERAFLCPTVEYMLGLLRKKKSNGEIHDTRVTAIGLSERVTVEELHCTYISEENEVADRVNTISNSEQDSAADLHDSRLDCFFFIFLVNIYLW